MALVDKTNFHFNKENMSSTNSRTQIGKELEQKMQRPMKSDVDAIKAAVSKLHFFRNDILKVLFELIFT